eukprot:6449664-Prymnesium_polylepis.1
MDAPLIGKRVTLADLKARSELNGLVADVLAFSEENSRYTVKLVRSEEQLALRSANLTVVQPKPHDGGARFMLGTRVTVNGLASKPELNGFSGTVTEYNEEKDRYGIQIDNQVKPMLLRGDNLRSVKDDWTPEWRTKEAQADIDQGLADHVAKEWESAKQGPFGGSGPGGI